MKKRLKTIDVFGDVLLNGGIFKELNNYDVPWKEDIEYTALDIEYFYNRSGQRYVSPLVSRLLGTSTTLSDGNKTILASTIYSMFGMNWKKLYDTLTFEYNPISNYDMVESETINAETSDTATHTGTQNIAHTGTQSESRTGTVGVISSESNIGSGSENSENDVFGFNSSVAVGDTSTTTSTSNTNTANGSNTRTDNLSDSRTDNLSDLRTDNLSDSRTDNLTDANEGTKEESRTLTRSGNIGVTTSQQMIESERALWLWNFFYDVVFPNVNKVLTIDTYSKEGYGGYYSSGGGGGDTPSDIVEKLNEISDKVDLLSNELSNDVSGIDTKLNSITSKVDTANGKIDTVSEKVDTVSGKVDTVSTKVDTANGKIDTVSTNVDTANGKIDTVITKVDAGVISINNNVTTSTNSINNAIDGVSNRAY